MQIIIREMATVGDALSLVNPLSGSKYYGAIVTRDPGSPGGLAREWLDRDRAYADVFLATGLAVGDVIEWGATENAGKRSERKVRRYWRCVARVGALAAFASGDSHHDVSAAAVLTPADLRAWGVANALRALAWVVQGCAWTGHSALVRGERAREANATAERFVHLAAALEGELRAGEPGPEPVIGADVARVLHLIHTGELTRGERAVLASALNGGER